MTSNLDAAVATAAALPERWLRTYIDGRRSEALPRAIEVSRRRHFEKSRIEEEEQTHRSLHANGASQPLLADAIPLRLGE